MAKSAKQGDIKSQLLCALQLHQNEMTHFWMTPGDAVSQWGPRLFSQSRDPLCQWLSDLVFADYLLKANFSSQLIWKTSS